jgi:hypothetical protein
LRKGETKARLKGRFGVSARTCEAYIRAARKSLMERWGTDRDEQRMLSFAFWVEVIRDPASSVRDMMFARHNLDILLGLVPKRRFRLRPSPPPTPMNPYPFYPAPNRHGRAGPGKLIVQRMFR